MGHWTPVNGTVNVSFRVLFWKGYGSIREIGSRTAQAMFEAEGKTPIFSFVILRAVGRAGTAPPPPQLFYLFI